MMKRTGSEPVTAPMPETNRAVVRPAFTRAADISSATASVQQRAELEEVATSGGPVAGTQMVLVDVEIHRSLS
jgi:hypothetical protein